MSCRSTRGYPFKLTVYETLAWPYRHKRQIEIITSYKLDSLLNSWLYDVSVRSEAWRKSWPYMEYTVRATCPLFRVAQIFSHLLWVTRRCLNDSRTWPLDLDIWPIDLKTAGVPCLRSFRYDSADIQRRLSSSATLPRQRAPCCCCCRWLWLSTLLVRSRKT